MSEPKKGLWGSITSRATSPKQGTAGHWVVRKASALNAWAYRASGGRVGGSFDGAPLVLVHHIGAKSGELGACLRVADGAGAHAVIAPKDHAVGINATVAKVASGAAETVPYFMVTNLARTLGELKERGIWVIGTSDDAPQTLYQADLKGPTALVLGAEGPGMRQLTRKSCDLLVRIPMHGAVESLNVSVASAVCLYEARRQRG